MTDHKFAVPAHALAVAVTEAADLMEAGESEYAVRGLLLIVHRFPVKDIYPAIELTKEVVAARAKVKAT